MKIIYLSNSRIPSHYANSVHVMKMCAAFSHWGHEVTLLAKRGTAFSINPFYFYGLSENFKIFYFRLASNKKENSIKGRFLKNFLEFYVRIKKPDLIYSRNPIAMAFLASLGIPFISENHYMPSNLKLEEYFHQNSNLYRTVVISQALKNDYIDTFQKFDKHRVLVAHDGADSISLEELPSNPLAEFNVGYVGSLYGGRGAEIISHLVEACPWANFHIVGGFGDELIYWKDKMASFANAFFHGFIPHREISKLISGFDVLLAPYQEKVETGGGKDTSRWMSPLKIFEYMSHGKAIVASDLNPIKEILSHRKNALLVSPQNHEQWVYALQTLYCDKDLREKIGCQAHKDFIGNYTWLMRAQKVLNGFTPKNKKK